MLGYSPVLSIGGKCVVALLLSVIVLLLMIYSFFEPKYASIFYLIFLLIFEGYLILLDMSGENVNTSKFNLDILEEKIFKKYFLFFYFPYLSKQLSSVLSGIQILTFIWVPWLLIKGQIWQSILIGLNYFIAGYLAAKLNPLFFLHRAIAEKPKAEYIMEASILESIIDKMLSGEIIKGEEKSEDEGS